MGKDSGQLILCPDLPRFMGMSMIAVKLIAHGVECCECQAVRKFFSDRAISFEEFDIDRNSSALQELVERTGSATHVPVVIVGDETFIDFNEEIAARILELISQNNATSENGTKEMT